MSHRQTAAAAFEASFAPSSPTARLLNDYALYGVTPGSDERDTRELPDADLTESSITALMDTMASLVADTRLEDETDELLWSLVNTFHRRIVHTEKRLDDIELKQRQSQREQDGSEIRSVELERLLDEGKSLSQTRDAFEAMREWAAESYHVQTGSPWLPRTGSKTSHKAVTAAVIDSRNFLSAKRRKETEANCPEGTKIAFAGGHEVTEVAPIWSALDKARAKYPDMVLIYGGTAKGAELIAARWAATRGVTAVAFKPDWNRHGKAAPFKRNDQMLEIMPQGVIAAPGNGITENLVDKAKKLGIAVMRIGA